MTVKGMLFSQEVEPTFYVGATACHLMATVTEHLLRAKHDTTSEFTFHPL